MKKLGQTKIGSSKCSKTFLRKCVLSLLGGVCFSSIASAQSELPQVADCHIYKKTYDGKGVLTSEEEYIPKGTSFYRIMWYIDDKQDSLVYGRDRVSDYWFEIGKNVMKYGTSLFSQDDYCRYVEEEGYGSLRHYEYDVNGYLHESLEYNGFLVTNSGDTSYANYYRYSYDDEGYGVTSLYLTQRKPYSIDDLMENSYDEDGKIEKTLIYEAAEHYNPNSEKGALSGKITYEYDSLGRRITEKVYDCKYDNEQQGVFYLRDSIVYSYEGLNVKYGKFIRQGEGDQCFVVDLTYHKMDGGNYYYNGAEVYNTNIGVNNQSPFIGAYYFISGNLGPLACALTRFDANIYKNDNGELVKVEVYAYDRFSGTWKYFSEAEFQDVAYTLYENDALKTLDMYGAHFEFNDEGYLTKLSDGSIEAVYDGKGNVVSYLVRTVLGTPHYELAFNNSYDDKGVLTSYSVEVKEGEVLPYSCELSYDEQGRLAKKIFSWKDENVEYRNIERYLYVDSLNFTRAYNSSIRYSNPDVDFPSSDIYVFETMDGMSVSRDGIWQDSDRPTNWLVERSDFDYYNQIAAGVEINNLGDTSKVEVFGYDQFTKKWVLLSPYYCEFYENGSVKTLWSDSYGGVVCHYSEDGHLVGGENADKTVRFTCDEHGNILTYESDKNKISVYTQYDEKYNIISQTWEGEDGKVQKNNYVYDENNRCVSMLSSFKYSGEEFSHGYFYTYGAPATLEYMENVLDNLDFKGEGVTSFLSELVSLYTEGKVICIDGLEDVVNVYDSKGSLVKSGTERNVRISVSFSGVYIVTVGDASAKVIVK